MPDQNDISIVLCGEAGQGIQTIEYILARILKLSGYRIFATKEYMSRVRGGSNSTQIRVSEHPVAAFLDRIDLLLPLDEKAIKHLEKRITPDTLILGDKANLPHLPSPPRLIDIPFGQLAAELGNPIFANLVAVGVIAGLFRVEPALLTNYLAEFFAQKSPEITEKNQQAAQKGYQIGSELLSSGQIKINLTPEPQVKEELLLDGSQAIALGALAGGCNFVAAYPMTPSTGIFTFLARQAEDFDLIVEQAEDEIAAVNMALGAWYAGARALVTTAGGGFALMVEGLSLSGMLENPLVISLGQRPAPATGLPTRTEQGDLEFALYAGHGEFPRIILAPGSLEQAFYLTQKAFNLADKFQSPVIILSDQYLVDSYYNIPELDLNLPIEKHIIKTDKAYQRYRLTESGLSPRGIPGFGEGLVCLDSDEHDETGHITEDPDLRAKMVEKRLRKLNAIENEISPPLLEGNPDYKNLVICWGSNYQIVKEALDRLKKPDTALLHFSWLYPLPGQTSDYLKKAQNLIIIENNATCQFGKLLKLKTGIKIEKQILKYNGLPFSVEEVFEKLKACLA